MAFTTLREAETAYAENLDYDSPESPSKAQLFCQACRYLLAFSPRVETHGGDSLQYAPEEISKQLETAQAWLLDHSDDEGGPRVTAPSFRTFRS